MRRNSWALVLLFLVAGCLSDHVDVGNDPSSVEERAVSFFTFDAQPSGSVGGLQAVVKEYELLDRHPANLSRINVTVAVTPPPTPGFANHFALLHDRDIFASSDEPGRDGAYHLSTDGEAYRFGTLHLFYSPPNSTGFSTATRLDVTLEIFTIHAGH